MNFNFMFTHKRYKRRRRKVVAQEKMIKSFNSAMFRNMVKALIFNANLTWVEKWLVNLSGSVLQ